MSEKQIYEMTKESFEDMSKDTIIEYLAALISKLLSIGVKIGGCQLEPDYIEIVHGDGSIQKVPGRLGEKPIWETMALNFAQHDEEVKKNFAKEILENI